MCSKAILSSNEALLIHSHSVRMWIRVKTVRSLLVEVNLIHFAIHILFVCAQWHQDMILNQCKLAWIALWWVQHHTHLEDGSCCTHFTYTWLGFHKSTWQSSRTNAVEGVCPIIPWFLYTEGGKMATVTLGTWSDMEPVRWCLIGFWVATSRRRATCIYQQSDRRWIWE